VLFIQRSKFGEVLISNLKPTDHLLNQIEKAPIDLLFQLELDRLSSQLELLRQRHVKSGSNRGVLCKIAAIQRVICEVDGETEDQDSPEGLDGHSLNNVIAAVTDKIVCAAMSGVDGDEDDLDMSVESAALNHTLAHLANSTVTLDDKTHFTNEISV